MFFYSFLVFILAAPIVHSAESQLLMARAQFFHQLQSPFLEVVEEGSPYFDEKLGNKENNGWIDRLLQFKAFETHPRGEPQWHPAECDPAIWQKKVLSTQSDFSALVEEYQSYLQRCQAQMETGRDGWLTNTLGVLTYHMDPNHYPFARHVILHFANGIKLKGLLAMKTDGKKRPLIIFRTGIFSNTQKFNPERYLFMQAFEQSPFNVLVLESLTGQEFLKHNASFAFGGFDEGLQNFIAAKQLQDPKEPLSRFVQSVHLMGISMGGHGVLFASLLNDLNPLPSGQPVIRSALAYCPLLNLKATLDYHFSKNISRKLMNFWAAKRLAFMQARSPGISDENFINDLLQVMEGSYTGPLIGTTADVHLPDRDRRLLQEKPKDLYWQLNDFWSDYHDVKTPVFIFSTVTDRVVAWPENSGKISDGEMNFAGSNVHMFPLAKGHHCSLPVAYEWNELATLLQTYFLKMSPDFHLAEREFRVPLTKEVRRSFRGAPILKTTFRALDRGSLQASIVFNSVPYPAIFEQFFAPVIKVTLPTQDFELDLQSAGALELSGDEREAIERWANQNIHVEIQRGEVVLRWSQVP